MYHFEHFLVGDLKVCVDYNSACNYQVLCSGVKLTDKVVAVVDISFSELNTRFSTTILASVRAAFNRGKSCRK